MTGKIPAFILTAALLVSTLSFSGCGGGGGKTPDLEGANFSVREALTEALQQDKAIDDNVLNEIQMVSSGQEPVETALDHFVDYNRSLLALIGLVAAPDKPPDTGLARAQELMQEYLRNRVHQVESCMAATNGAELESLYGQGKQQLQDARKTIRDLLVKYNPELDKTIP